MVETKLLCAVLLGLAAVGCSGKPAEQVAPVASAGANATASGNAGNAAGSGGATSLAPAGVNAASNAKAGAGGVAATSSAGTTAGSGSAAQSGGSAAASNAGRNAAGTSAVAGNAAGAGGAVGGPKLPAANTVSGPGPFKTMQNLSTGPKGQSGLFRPEPLGENGLKHPVFVWGCGGTASPSTYAEQLNLLASHGFVVIGEVENIGDNGAPLLAAADWIVAENARQGSALYQKLDTSKLGLGGHSIGSVNSFLAGTDARWTTTVHVAGGSLDNVNDPNAKTTGKGGKALIHPTAYICSKSDVFGNVEKTEKDYENTTVPVFFTIMEGADHVGAVRAGIPAIVAWLRWQLGGEEERRASFLDPQGEFRTGKYVSRSKNW